VWFHILEKTISVFTVPKFTISQSEDVSTVLISCDIKSLTWGPFLEGPEKFWHPESRSKISNIMITELCYSHIFKMNRGSLHSRGFRRTQLSGFRERSTKNGFAGPKSFRTLRLQHCFIHVFLIWTEVLFIQEVSGVYTTPFVDTDELKMVLRARKVSGAFEKRGPGPIR